MPYYHDARNKTVICAPETPTVFEKKTKRGESEGWEVSARLDVTRADNYIDPKTGQWRYPVRELRQDWYASRDFREAAISFFATAKYPSHPEISSEDYLRLKTEYEETARSNKPPTT